MCWCTITPETKKNCRNYGAALLVWGCCAALALMYLPYVPLAYYDKWARDGGGGVEAWDAHVCTVVDSYVSSTEVRRAVAAGDAAACARLLHPRVAEWCLRESPWRATKPG